MSLCPSCGLIHEAPCPVVGASLRAEGSGVALPVEGALASRPRLHRTPLPADTLLGSYRILGPLGEGGMGLVYRGEHARLGRPVAIKVLRPDLALRPDVVARFFGEARAVNQIRHSHIIDVHDFVELEPGCVFIVMELLDGCTLKTLIDREGPLPAHRAVPMAVQMADALMAVHERGIVHRDLKPENIFLVERDGYRDFVKILDFGIAKLGDAGDLAHTQTGTVFGTPQYMSPEQARGFTVDGRSDVYALGMILYTMLTGAPAFDGVAFGDVMMKQVLEPLPPLRSRVPDPEALPAALEQVVETALSKDRQDRFPSMEEMYRALVRSVEGQPTVQASDLRLPRSLEYTAQVTPGPVGLLAGRGRWWAGALGLGLAAALLAGGLLWKGNRFQGADASAERQDSLPPPAVLVPLPHGPPRESLAAAEPRSEFISDPAPQPTALPASEGVRSANGGAPLVAVTFTSRPAGGTVLGPRGEPLCETPCTQQIPWEASAVGGALSFRVRRAGFRDGVAAVRLPAGHDRLQVAFPPLAPLPSSKAADAVVGQGARTAPEEVPPIDRVDTLDPFR